MAKNVQLIPGDNRNWEIAIFLLINHLYNPKSNLPSLTFSRIELHSSVKSMNFIEKLLGSIGYEVNKTLSNTISSTITQIVRNGFLSCIDEQCKFTKKGIDRFYEIITKYNEKNKVPIGKAKEIIEDLKKHYSKEELRKLLCNSV